MKNRYSQSFIDEQKVKLVADKDRVEKELLEVAKYDEVEDKYIPKFEELSPGESEDNEEAADEESTYEENIAIAKDLVESLEEIKSALEKIEKGTYGYCSNCNEYISEERLKAYPAAATCVKCEEE